MNVPDYVAPIVAARIWRWDGTKIVSLNGVPWIPGQVLRAECKLGRDGIHRVPEIYCCCGVYAAKTTSELHRMFRVGGNTSTTGIDFISGEVYLWGVVVEHELGWRAQFAYPKSLVLPLGIMPTYDHIQEFCSDKLLPYGVDLYFANGNNLIPLWSQSAGYLRKGLVFAKKHENRKDSVSSKAADANRSKGTNKKYTLQTTCGAALDESPWTRYC
jgi:hypothetical protein